jgi:hypothetical protein
MRHILRMGSKIDLVTVRFECFPLMLGLPQKRGDPWLRQERDALSGAGNRRGEAGGTYFTQGAAAKLEVTKNGETRTLFLRLPAKSAIAVAGFSLTTYRPWLPPPP